MKVSIIKNDGGGFPFWNNFVRSIDWDNEPKHVSRVAIYNKHLQPYKATLLYDETLAPSSNESGWYILFRYEENAVAFVLKWS